MLSQAQGISAMRILCMSVLTKNSQHQNKGTVDPRGNDQLKARNRKKCHKMLQCVYLYMQISYYCGHVFALIDKVKVFNYAFEKKYRGRISLSRIRWTWLPGNC